MPTNFANYPSLAEKTVFVSGSASGIGAEIVTAFAAQGSQFTSIDFIKTLKDANIQISMDGKGAWWDNVFVERLWRMIKYEEIYLRAYDSVSAARESLRRYLAFYNGKRPHLSLDGQTPDQAYLNPPRPISVAA